MLSPQQRGVSRSCGGRASRQCATAWHAGRARVLPAADVVPQLRLSAAGHCCQGVPRGAPAGSTLAGSSEAVSTAASAAAAAAAVPLGVGRHRRSLRAGSSSVRAAAAPAAAAAAEACALPKAERLVMDVAGQQIVLETGEIGRQANGAVMASMGDTVLYATACCGNSPQGDGSFLPLSVHYQERFSAAGRTSGSFLKREGRPRHDDVLVARLVDRPLRPMFEAGWCNETQILEWVLSYDGVNQPEPLAITAAAAALLISDIPLVKAVAGVRVGYLPAAGGWVINPSAAQMASSKLDLLMAGTADAVLMIEGFCDWLTEEQMIEAVAAGHAAISQMCDQLTAWASKVGKSPKRAKRLLPPPGLTDQMHVLAAAQVEAAYRETSSKDARSSRVAAVQAAAFESVRAMEAFAGINDATLNAAWKKFESGIMRRLVLAEGVRADGRGLADIRPISSRAGVLPRTHGSALFTRGETQALCVATLGSESDAQRIDSIRGAESSMDEAEAAAAAARSLGLPPAVGAAAAPPAVMGVERFYLQYFFPPSSVGECGRVGPAGRRELGHGELAQRALAPAVPPQADFPYTVRVESTITESNGSSSMASVCGGCLALLDAGVPLSEPVAGIAMGLILEPDGSYVVLSDILGSEDALGDMDFKVAGGASGISAFQMDIKVEGITLDIMRQALAQAAAGRAHILQQMGRCDPPPTRALSKWAPKVLALSIPPDKMGQLIGPGGKIIKGITAAAGVTNIETGDGGAVQVVGTSESSLQLAKEMILLQLDELQPGTILRQRKVSNVVAFGVVVELLPGKTGLVHLSELGDGAHELHEVPATYKVGDMIDVMYIGTNYDGKTRLSQKGVLLRDAGKPYEPTAFGRGGGSSSSSSNGSGPPSPRTPRSEGEGSGGLSSAWGGGSGGRSGGRGRGGRGGRGEGGGRGGGRGRGRGDGGSYQSRGDGGGGSQGGSSWSGSSSGSSSSGSSVGAGGGLTSTAAE